MIQEVRLLQRAAETDFHTLIFPHPNLAVSPHESQQTAPAPLVLSVGITQPAARRRLHILSFHQQEHCTLCSRPYEWRSGKLEEMAEKAEAKRGLCCLIGNSLLVFVTVMF